jgi:hypothetical protein
MNQKVKKIEIPEVSLSFIHTKKVEIWSFIRARIHIRFRIRIQSQTSGTGSDQKGPDPQHCPQESLQLNDNDKILS